MAKIQLEAVDVVARGRQGGSGTPDFPGGLLGEQSMSQIQGAHAARARARYAAVMGNGSTFIGSVTAVPTTTLTMALWNNPANKKSLFVDRVFAIFISGTSALGASLWVCLTATAQTNPSFSTGANGGYASTVISNLGGLGAPGGSQAALLNAITATGGQPAWFPVAKWEGTNATTTIANQNLISDDLQGGIEIQPGYMMGMVVIEAAGTSPLWAYGALYSEY